jgi:hypothetical protein
MVEGSAQMELMVLVAYEVTAMTGRLDQVGAPVQVASAVFCCELKHLLSKAWSCSFVFDRQAF